jgi:hypothetical protein
VVAVKGAVSVQAGWPACRLGRAGREGRRRVGGLAPVCRRFAGGVCTRARGERVAIEASGCARRAGRTMAAGGRPAPEERAAGRRQACREHRSGVVGQTDKYEAARARRSPGAISWNRSQVQRLRDRLDAHRGHLRSARSAAVSGRGTMPGAGPRRGLISSLVYLSTSGSIGDYGRPVSTANDLPDRAETVMLAPEKRKVGGSIPPLTTV